jgi:hypothetical protein
MPWLLILSDWPTLRELPRCASIGERGAEVHAPDSGSRCSRLAQAARPRRRVEDGALDFLLAQPALSIANGLTLGVSIGILMLDDPTRPFSYEHAI